MIIQIDMRERELIAKMNTLISTIPLFKDVQTEVLSLPLADIIFFDNDTDTPQLLIERKTINDLLSSIKDGRYEEQSFRLNGTSTHNHNIIYLIEGDMNKKNYFKDTKNEKLTVCSAIFSLNYYKGFSAIRTLDLEETAIFLCNSFVKLSKERNNKKAYYNHVSQAVEEPVQEPVVSTDKEYVNVSKRVKKENITCENIGEIMLCQIPGVSSVSALAILEKYKSLSNLIKELDKEPNCLKDITTVTKTGQTRKISKTVIENIKKFVI
uniref:ERCC4 domain-containing protein n=1 Tax=viral metagenome TaxID=1070528 RepID=A0A6C0LMH4_9ZZZZ